MEGHTSVGCEPELDACGHVVLEEDGDLGEVAVPMCESNCIHEHIGYFHMEAWGVVVFEEPILSMSVRSDSSQSIL